MPGFDAVGARFAPPMMVGPPNGAGTNWVDWTAVEPSASRTIRVFLVDSHEVVRYGMRTLLEREEDLTVVGEVGSAGAALEQLPPTVPDVAVLDVWGRDDPLLALRSTLRHRSPRTRWLVVAPVDDRAALATSADGWVPRQASGAEFVGHVRRVARGERVSHAACGRALGEWPLQSRDDDLDYLTAQERRILDLLGRGLTNRQIGDQLNLAEKTIKNYVSNLLSKLGMCRRTEAAALVGRLDERHRLARLGERPAEHATHGTFAPGLQELRAAH